MKEPSNPLSQLGLVLFFALSLLWAIESGIRAGKPKVDPLDPEFRDLLNLGAQELPPRIRVALGWQVPCGEERASIWEQVPGIGPVLARRLAYAARHQELQSPPDLLQIRGIHHKMASKLTPWICWPSPPDPAVSKEQR